MNRLELDHSAGTPDLGRSPGAALGRRRVLAGALATGLGLGTRRSSAAAGRLTVDGPIIRYDGTPIMLRGVAMTDALLGRHWRDASDYDEVVAWNANLVRLSVHPSTWKRRREEALKALATDVDAALERGLFVIIDWHPIGWPDGWMHTNEWGEEKDSFDTTFDLARSFWDTAAQRWGRDGRILFELWNEPVRDPKEDHQPQETWPKLAAHWGHLTRIVRRHSQNIVIAAPDRWASDLRTIRKAPLPDRNTAYAWHIYPTSFSGPKNWTELLDGLPEQRPVILTEWGFRTGCGQEFSCSSAKDFGQPFVDDFIMRYGLHHTAWCFHTDWSPPMLEKDWRTPNEFGRVVKAHLQGNSQRRSR